MKKIYIYSFLFLLFSIQILAQSKSNTDTLKADLNTVIITANRQASLRSEAPISIYKLSNQIVNDTKASQLTELLNKVPGVVMASFNHEQHTIAIRQPIGLNPYFLFMEDGIPIRPMGIFQNNGLIEINQAAIESIEVIKGPSSSLYGPEAAGGAINFISLQPTDEFKYSLGYQHDAFGYFQSKGKFSGKITEKLSIAAAGLFIKQKNSWQPSSDFHKTGINFSADYKYNQSTKFLFRLSKISYKAEAGGSVDSATFYSRKFVSQAAFAYRNIEAFRMRFIIEKSWKGNISSINYISRKNIIAQFPAYSIRRIPGNPNAAHGEINANQFESNSILIQNSTQFSNKKAKLIVGLSGDYAPNDYYAFYVRLNRDAITGVNSVNKIRNDSVLVNYTAKILNLAAYAQLDYEISPQFKMVIGSRFDVMKYDFNNFLKPSSFAGAPDEQNSFQRFTPKIGFTYQFTRKIGAYLNGSQGFSPPNISQLYRGVKVPELKEATFNNIEVGGWASFFKNKINIEASIYYMPSKNEVVRFVNSDNSVENKSAGSAIHKGVEYSINYQPNTQLKLSLNGTNARHFYDSFRLSDKQIFDGKEMPQAPHFTGMGDIQYRPKWLKGFRISAEWQRVGPFFKDNDNKLLYDDKTFAGLKGLSLLHLRSAYHFKKFEIFANILNLTDELYTTYISRSTFGSNFYPAPPRNLTLGISWGNF